MSWSAVVAIPVSWILPQQTVAILYSVQAIIDNGGFQYLFENDFPFNPPYSKFVEAYRRIGSHQVAERLANAVAMFPFENPHLKQAERLKFMETLEEENEFLRLETKFVEISKSGLLYRNTRRKMLCPSPLL